MLDAFGTPTSLVAAGGNSRLARSARAKLQWRDRFGRWVEMGRGVKFKLRRKDGTVLSVTGKFVGAVDGDTGSVYVKDDSNGFADGFYKVKSSNGQEILATLSDGTLEKADVELGKDVNGALVGDRADADIQNEDDPNTYSDAPEGWVKQSENNFATDDNEFTATLNTDGSLAAQREDEGGRTFKDWPELIETIDEVDDGTAQWAGDENAPQRPQDAPETANAPAGASTGGLDTDTFDVAREGFLVPTGKKGSTSDLPGFIAANKDFLGEGGKRLVINTDDNSVEIHNSADTLDNAKAQAGGIGVPDFIDLTTGERVNTGDTPNATDRSADSVQPEPANAGPDQPVDQPSAEQSPAGDRPAGDQPAPAERPAEPAPADNDALGQPIPGDRAGLEQRIAFLERATQRVSPDSDQFDATYQARDEVQARLDSFEDKIDAIQESVDKLTGDVPKASEPTPGPAPEPDAPEAPAALEVDTRTDEINARLDGIQETVDALREEAAPEPVEAVEPVAPFEEGEQVQWRDPNTDGLRSGEYIRPSDNNKDPENPRSLVKPALPKKGEAERFAVPDATLFRPGEETGRELPPETPASDWAVNPKRPSAQEINDAPEGAQIKLTRRGITVFKGTNGKWYDAGNDNAEVKVGELRTNAELGRAQVDQPEPVVDPEPVAAPEPESAPEVIDEPVIEPEADLDRAEMDQREADQAEYDRQNQEEFARQQAEDEALIKSAESLVKRRRNAMEKIRQEYGAFDIPPNSDAGRRLEIAKQKLADAQSMLREARREDAPVVEAPESPELAPGGVITPREEPISEPETPEQIVPLEEPGDGLPDSVDELETMAGNMEREIATARASRARVLREQVDRIYDKIDSITGDNTRTEPVAEQEAPAAVEPQPEIVEYANPAAASMNAALAMGKEFSPEDREAILTELRGDGLSQERLNEIQADIAARPNSANTVTAARPAADTPWLQSTHDPAIVDAENDPASITDPNVIMADIQRSYPEFTTLPNNDTVIHTREINGKRYDLAIRRTDREEFFAYVKETNLATGESRGIRMRRGNHSYKALLTQINRGKIAINGDPEKYMKRRRGSVETIPAGEELGKGPLGGYIEGTDIPRSNNELYNTVVESLAKMLEDPDVAAVALKSLATDNGFKPGLVTLVKDSIRSQKVAELHASEDDDKPSHISFDGTQLVPGDWVDWTDTNLTINDGVTPNPNYGRVYRGQVKNLQYETTGNAYVYSDSTNVTFEEWNRELGRKPSWQRPRISSKLKKVDGPNAPASEPFFAKAEEHLREQKIVSPASFNVPEVGTDTVERPAPLPESSFDPIRVGDHSAHPEFPEVAIPASRIEAAEQFLGLAPNAVYREEIVPGDVITVEGDHAREFTVLSTDTEGEQTVLRLAGNNEDGSFIERTRTITGPQALVVWRENEFAAPEVDVDFDDDDGFAREATRTALRTALVERRVTGNQKARLRKKINDPQLTEDDAIDLFQEIDGFRFPAEQPIAVDSVQAMLEDIDREFPDLGGGEAARLIDVDLDAIKDAPNDPVYEGYDVAGIDFKDIEFDLEGGAPFVRQESVPNNELIVGDLIQGGVHGEFYYAQVLNVRTNSAGVFVTARLVLPDGAKNLYTNFGFASNHGDIKQNKLPRFGSSTILRPTGHVADNYFKDPSKRPEIRKPRVAAMDTLRDEPDFELAEDVERQSQSLADSYREGFTPESERMTRGAMHIEAAIGTTLDGRRVFTKVVSNEEAYINEVLAMRVANIIGIDTNHTAHTGWGEDMRQPGFTRRIVMDAIDGEVGAASPQQVLSAIRGMSEGREDAVNVGILDYITKNADRNAGNYMFNADGNVVPIDHEFVNWRASYFNSPFTTELLRLIREGNAPVTSAQLLRLKNNLQAIRSTFLEVGAIDNFTFMIQNLDTLIDGVNGHAL